VCGLRKIPSLSTGGRRALLHWRTPWRSITGLGSGMSTWVAATQQIQCKVKGNCHRQEQQNKYNVKLGAIVTGKSNTTNTM
jgi:hypothetical protein